MVAVQKKLLVEDKQLSPFAVDALKGLRGTRKTIPPKYFYDAKGSELFEQITEQPEYYPTRTELGILEENGAAIAAIIPQGAALVEFGSGASRKTRTLLRFAPQVAAYVPVEICPDMVREQARDLQREFPNLKVFPVEADFSAPFDLPADVEAMPKTGFFPGSTIGNFEPHQAASFLRQAARILGHNATFVIGFDLIKESEIINAAYNDAAGITAAFNMNILTRLNRDLGANFDPPRSSIMLSSIANAIAWRCIWPRASGRRSGSSARRWNSAPARPSIPRAATNIRSTPSRRLHGAPAGRRS